VDGLDDANRLPRHLPRTATPLRINAYLLRFPLALLCRHVRALPPYGCAHGSPCLTPALRVACICDTRALFIHAHIYRWPYYRHRLAWLSLTSAIDKNRYRESGYNSCRVNSAKRS